MSPDLPRPGQTANMLLRSMLPDPASRKELLHTAHTAVVKGFTECCCHRPVHSSESESMLAGVVVWSYVSVIVLITCLLAGVLVEAVQHTNDLSVNVPLFGQSIGAEEQARYTLQRMQPSTSYEVRISYPATVRPFLPLHVLFSFELQSNAVCAPFSKAHRLPHGPSICELGSTSQSLYLCRAQYQHAAPSCRFQPGYTSHGMPKMQACSVHPVLVEGGFSTSRR